MLVILLKANKERSSIGRVRLDVTELCIIPYPCNCYVAIDVLIQAAGVHTVTKNVVYPEALLSAPRVTTLPPPSPERPTGTGPHFLPDAPGDQDDMVYS